MTDWKISGTLALGCLVALYLGRQTLRRRTLSFPPGPPGLPWVGNVVGVNTDAPWLTYAEWAKTYGDLVYTRLLGKDIIIINSERVAKDLLEVRSRNYSDRPMFVTLGLSGQQFTSSFLPYGDQWRLHRRFFHQTFRLAATHRFLPYQQQKACHLLRQLLETPEKLHDHVFEYTTSVILNSAYNYEPAIRGDVLIDMAKNLLAILVRALRSDISVILGAFPWLFYLPSWLPGMSFKKDMTEARVYSTEYLGRPFDYSLQRLSDSCGPCMVHDALRSMESMGASPEESWMQELKEASGTAFLAASETSNAVLMAFFLLMIVNPAVQEKAQAQIDVVVGRGRLPTMDDRPLLPMIDAIFREILRYNPVLPLSLPHVSIDDDMYGEYHIPKGAILLANLWSIAHDESRYPNPHVFMPERFLNDDGSLKPDDTEHIMFGFGRRMCVGRHFADASLWTVMSTVLAVFKILPALDEHGVEVPVEPKYSSGIAIRPLPFKYRIVPRYEEMDAERLAQLNAAGNIG